MVTLNRLRSFLLCDDYHPIGIGDLKENGVRIDNVSAAYDSKRPQSSGGATMDPKSKELADKDWEVALLQAQLADAERCIQQLTYQEDAPKFDNGSGHGTPSSSLICMGRVNFQCRPGELVAVVGGVGCGKSTLINSILGEVRLLTGKLAVKGDLAYFSQTPFIMNASVRDNILFGHVEEPIDEELYQRALTCCALKHDLELLPDGDQTEVGERGITLSGGQKVPTVVSKSLESSFVSVAFDLTCLFLSHKRLVWLWHVLYTIEETSLSSTTHCPLSMPMLQSTYSTKLLLMSC
jgi:ABC-type multidrug transport system fused ATPase/permease subunit